RREQPFAEEADPGGRVGAGVLLLEDDLLREIERAAAVLRGPRHPDPAVLTEDALPLDANVPAFLVGRPAPTADGRELAHEMVRQPGADLGAESSFFGSVAEIHA